jgi:hypothetical protein
MNMAEADFLNVSVAFLPFLFSLTGKTNDDIGGDIEIWNSGPRQVDDLSELFGFTTPSHTA